MKAREVREQDHKNAIFRLSGWYMANMLLVKAASLWLLPIYTRYLTPSDFGVLRTLTSTAMAFPMLISLSLGAAYTRFYFTECEKENGLKRLVSTYFWFILIWGLMVTILGNVICDQFLRHRLKVSFWPYVPLALAVPLIQQLATMGSVHFKLRLQAKKISVIDTITFVVGTATTLYLLVAMKYGVLSMLIGGVSAAVLALCIYVTVLVRADLLSFQFDFDVLKKGLRFSLPYVPMLACTWIAGLSDRLVILFYGTTASVGLYSLGYDIGRMLSIVSSSVNRVFDPVLWSTITTDVERAKERIERYIPFYFWITFGGACTLSLFAKEIILGLTDSKFHSAWVVTPIVAFAYLVSGLYGPFSNILAYHDKAWLVALGAFVQAVSNLILNLILVPMFGPLAAAWTTLGSFFILTLWTWYYSRSYVKIKIGWRYIGTSVSVGLAAVTLYFLTSPFIGEALWQSFLLKCCVLAFACFLSYLLPVFDKRPDEIYPISDEKANEAEKTS